MEKSYPSIVEKTFSNINYALSSNKLCYINKDNKYIPICNFIPYVREKKVYTNGRNSTILYTVECQLLENKNIRLKPLIVDSTSFSNFDFIESSPWENYAIIEYPQTQNKSKLKFVMQSINKLIMKEEIVYAHTGLKEIDGELCYLYHRTE